MPWTTKRLTSIIRYEERPASIDLIASYIIDLICVSGRKLSSKKRVLPKILPIMLDATKFLNYLSNHGINMSNAVKL